jgi:hypothetical protein
VANKTAVPAVPTPPTNLVHRTDLAAPVRAMIDTVSSQIVDANPAEVSLTIIERILSSASPDEVFANAGALVKNEHLLGVPIEVTGIAWQESTFEGETSLGFYCVFDFVNLETNQKGSAGAGALSAMTQLYQLNLLGKLPYEMVLTTTTKPTKTGYYPQYFRPLSEQERDRLMERGGTPVDEEPF